VAPGQVLKALKQQVLNPQLVEPEGVGEEDEVKEEVAEQGHDDQGLAAVGVGEGTSEDNEDNARDALEHAVVGLDLGHILLHVLLHLLVMAAVVADLSGVVQVDLAGLGEVEVLAGDHHQAEVDTEEEEDGLQGYRAEDILGGLEAQNSIQPAAYRGRGSHAPGSALGCLLAVAGCCLMAGCWLWLWLWLNMSVAGPCHTAALQHAGHY
jgi:hypothetical protein